MAKVRLLRRLGLWQQKDSGNASDLQHILVDLEKLLNVQRGNVLIDSNIGLPDFRSLFHSHIAPDIEQLTSLLSEQIRMFEPRLTALNLEPQERAVSSGHLAWQLSAQSSQRSDLYLEADILVDTNGTVQVQAKA